MGCGSSTLKGDGPSGIGGEQQPQPIRKIATNFSTIDYDQNASANQKRRMTEYAPEDTIRNKSEAGGSAGVDPSAAGAAGGSGKRVEGEGEKSELEPYHTREDGDGVDPAGVGYPHENPRSSGGGAVNGAGQGHGHGDGLDPTSGEAKDRFAQANDPAVHNGGGVGGLAPPVGGDGEGEGGKRKGSWLDRLKDKDRRDEISDEDMKKYTGMSKAEMKEYVESGQGVGARQAADHQVTANAAGGGGY